MTWQIWFACAVIVLAVLALVKRYETRMVLVLAGLVMCAAAGEPIKAFQAFVKGMTNINLVPAICSAMGFAAVVTATKCDQHLVAAVAAPLKKLGGLLIPVTTVLTFCINIAIMSAAGTAATAGATFIPLLIRAGIRPAAAAAAVGGGTMSGLLLNPGCAHDIYVAKMANMDLMAFIGWAAPYVVGLVLLATIVNAALAIFHYKDHKPSAEEMANLNLSDKEAFKVNYLRALAPLVPLIILMSASVWFPKAGIDVVAAMLIGIVVIALITMMNPSEISKAFFKGMGSGYAQVIGLIVAAGVFTAGLQTTGTVGGSQELERSRSLGRRHRSLPHGRRHGFRRGCDLGLQPGRDPSRIELRHGIAFSGSSRHHGRPVRPHGEPACRMHHHRGWHGFRRSRQRCQASLPRHVRGHDRLCVHPRLRRRPCLIF